MDFLKILIFFFFNFLFFLYALVLCFFSVPVFHACELLLVHYFVLAPVITQQSSCCMYEAHTVLIFIVSAKGLQLLLWHYLYLSVTFSIAFLLLCLSSSKSLRHAPVFCGNGHCTPNVNIKNKILSFQVTSFIINFVSFLYEKQMPL